MAVASIRLVPRGWRRRSARSARLRLTLMYSGLFLLLGTAVVIITFILVRGAAIEQSVARAVPGPPGAPAIHAAFAQHSADIARLLGVSWLTLAVTAVVSALLGWWVAGRVLRPLRQMTETARTISAGNLHARLALTGPVDEFKQLGDAFDDLLGRLEASFAAQRRFVANAAHELRTPLTLERTLLQVALADPDASASSLRTTCEELLATGRGHERLIESLLTLATSERGLERRESVDLAAALQDALDRSAAEIHARQLEVRADVGEAVIAGDRALIERLIANLLDNALRYNRTGGVIDVQTSSDGEGVTLAVANDGPLISAGEIERLFEPFQRLEPERTASEEGYGLGLSIVRAIAAAHDAEIKLGPRFQGGLVMTARFPAPQQTA